MSLKQVLFIFIFSTLLFGQMPKGDWEMIYETPELSVYRKEVPGYKTFAFKAVGIIKSPVSKVASVLIDIERRKEWMPDVGDTYIVQELGQDQRIEYVHIKTPFIIKDREFVLHSKAAFNKEERTFIFNFDSAPNSVTETSNRIRAELYESHYILKDLGDSTEVEFTVHLDPKGSVPKFLVNLIQKDYPRKTIEALAKQSMKTDIKESALVLRELALLNNDED